MRRSFSLLTFVFFPVLAFGQASGPDSLVEQYRADADRLIDAALADSFAYDRLASMTDTYGPRISGSQALEDAIDWMLEEMHADGLENVRGEDVMVPRWVRGRETLTLLEPRVADLRILGLGGTIGTSPMGVTAEVLVVNSYDDLTANADKAAGKIILYNNAKLFFESRNQVYYG